VDKKKKSIVENISIVVIGSSNTPNSYLLSLANSLNFDFSFLILPDIISDNTPVPF
jgi:hypothetical protein